MWNEGDTSGKEDMRPTTFYSTLSGMAAHTIAAGAGSNLLHPLCVGVAVRGIRISSQHCLSACGFCILVEYCI